MFRRAVLIALASLAIAPATAGAQQTAPPEPLDEFSDSAVSATALELCWSSENADQVDSWTLTMVRGTTPPPPGTPGTEIPGGKTTTCHQVDGLETSEAYTFALVGHNAAGDGPRQTHTAAAREQGAFVRDAGGTRRLPLTDEHSLAALATSPTTGREHAVFLGPPVAPSHTQALYYATRPAGGRWSAAQRITTHMTDGVAAIAVNRRGDVAIGWSSLLNGPEYRLLRAGTKRWAAARSIPSPRPFHERLDAVALDRRGNLHVALTRSGDWPGVGVHVRTLLAGRWRDDRVAGTTCAAPYAFECRSLLVVDPVTDRITLAARHTAGGTATVVVADAPAGASRLGRAHRVASSSRTRLRLLPASLDARGGRVMLALRGKPPLRATDAPGAGLYLATGTSAARMGAARRIPGTGARDSWAAGVAVTGARTGVLAWQRDAVLDWREDSFADPSWNTAEQGVWTRRITLAKRTGAPRYGAPSHVDDSPYGALLDLAADRHGRPVVGFLR